MYTPAAASAGGGRHHRDDITATVGPVARRAPTRRLTGFITAKGGLVCTNGKEVATASS